MVSVNSVGSGLTFIKRRMMTDTPAPECRRAKRNKSSVVPCYDTLTILRDRNDCHRDKPLW